MTMNDPYFQQHTQPGPPPANNEGRTPKKWPKLTVIKYGAIAVAALLVGVAIGMSGESAIAEELEQVKSRLSAVIGRGCGKCRGSNR